MLFVLLLSVAVPVSAQVTTADIGTADQAVGEARARLEDARARLAEEERRLERVRESLDRIADRIAARDLAIEGGWEEARERVARMYMTAGTGKRLGVMVGADVGIGAQVAYLGALADREREFVLQLVASRTDLSRLAESVNANLTDQQLIVDDAAAAVSKRSDELAAAEGKAAEVRAQWQREEDERRRIAEEERSRREEEERLRLEEEERQRPGGRPGPVWSRGEDWWSATSRIASSMRHCR
jgi:peptidoglycan hydrolase CwlO-like protein